MAIQTPQALQNARLVGFAVPQPQHSMVCESGSGGGPTFGAAARDERVPAEEDRGRGIAMEGANEPPTDATASVGRGETGRSTSESQTAQKLASCLTGVPHMGQADGVSTPGVSGSIAIQQDRQSCVAEKYQPLGRTDHLLDGSSTARQQVALR